MKKIMPHVAGVFFSLFGIGVIALLMSYTFSALAHIFPDNFTAQAMGMILFDVAALAWLGAFIYLCKSVMQYAFAFIGFAFGLGGSLAMVAMEVMLGGQELIEAPAWVNQALIYGFIGAAVVHVVLYYAYKLSAPEVSADISLGIETAEITGEAMKQAEAQLLRDRSRLGRTIAPRLITNVQRNLGLPITGEVVDAPAYDVAEKPIPVQIPNGDSFSFWDRLRAAKEILVNPVPVAPRQYSASASTIHPTPSKPEPITTPQESEVIKEPSAPLADPPK